MKQYSPQRRELTEIGVFLDKELFTLCPQRLRGASSESLLYHELEWGAVIHTETSTPLSNPAFAPPYHTSLRQKKSL